MGELKKGACYNDKVAMQASLFITGGSSSSSSYYLFWKTGFVIAAAYYTREPLILNWFA